MARLSPDFEKSRNSLDRCVFPPILLTLGPTLRYTGHVRFAKHPSGREVAVKILPALDFTEKLRKDAILDAQEAQKEVILLKVFGGLGLVGTAGLDMVKEEGGWK